MKPKIRAVYFIQNEDGRYIQYRSYRLETCWTTDINNARIYHKLGAAKGTVTWMVNQHPGISIPTILEFELIPSNAKVIDITAHVQASITKKIAKDKAYEIRRADDLKWRLLREQQEIADQLAKL